MTDGEVKRTFSNKWNITHEAPIFTRYLPPHGFLDRHPACHALFRYYLSARLAYEEIILDPIVYEGEKDPVFNFEQMFKSMADWYKVEPEVMVKFWKNVDLQCWALKIPEMPQGDRFRFDHVPNIKIKDVMLEAPIVRAGKALKEKMKKLRLN